jgi:carbon monoxide dehydrogenase subunit G
MQDQGERHFRLPPKELFKRLSDAQWLVSTLTQVQVVRASNDEAVWSMRPALAFMSGSIENTLTISERNPDSSIRLHIRTQGIGATATVEIHLELLPVHDGTMVRWRMTIPQLTGLLKLAPRGLLQATAGKVVNEVWSQVEAALAHEAGESRQ